MACVIPNAPPNTRALSKPYPNGSHAYAQELLDRAIKQGYPLGYFELGTLQGRSVCAQYTKHTETRGTFGCFPAVTLFDYIGPALPSPLPTPMPSGVVTEAATKVDWGTVALTGSALVATVSLFFLALRHAGKANK